MFRACEARAACTDENPDVRTTVETLIKETEPRGDIVLREYSRQFGIRHSADFRLSQVGIEAARNRPSLRDIENFTFAQTPVRNFALEHRKLLPRI